jgi:hypothetical protein
MFRDSKREYLTFFYKISCWKTHCVIKCFIHRHAANAQTLAVRLIDRNFDWEQADGLRLWMRDLYARTHSIEICQRLASWRCFHSELW